jgi:hypothetical protein
MNIEPGKRISLIRGISSNDKGKLMWNESYELGITKVCGRSFKYPEWRVVSAW